MFISSSDLEDLNLCRLVLLPPATAFRGSLFRVENVVSTNIPTSLLIYGVSPAGKNQSTESIDGKTI